MTKCTVYQAQIAYDMGISRRKKSGAMSQNKNI
jgi:hypothetical protein